MYIEAEITYNQQSRTDISGSVVIKKLNNNQQREEGKRYETLIK